MRPVTHEKAVIGNNVSIGFNVILTKGTVIGDNCIIGDNVIFTGACWIGNNVNIRPGAIISKGVVIEDWVFVGPGVITNHTKHVDWGRDTKSKALVTYVGFGSVLGSGSQYVAGVQLGHHSIIGAGSVVTKNIPGEGIYVGTPATFISSVPEGGYVNKNHRHKMYHTEEVYQHLKKHIPNLANWNGF